MRMNNPVLMIPNVLDSLLAANKAIDHGSGLDAKLRLLVVLRASQINGCSWCTEAHARELKEAGESDERLYALAAWQDAPFYTPAERAALALAESATRIADQLERVPDAIWEEAKRHFDETTLAALVLHIALINFWNRINVMVQQPAGWRPRMPAAATGKAGHA